MIRIIKPVVVFACLCPLLMHAQDPRERTYNYAVLKPNHVQKTRVEGWAQKRVTETLNRGLIAIETCDSVLNLSGLKVLRPTWLNLRENSLFLRDNQIFQ